jgi:hypothetical protein
MLKEEKNDANKYVTRIHLIAVWGQAREYDLAESKLMILYFIPTNIV